MAGNDPADDDEPSGRLSDESGESDEDAEDFLSDEQLAAYGCYARPPTVDELTTLRYLGKFLDDPLDVPVVVLDDVAAQLGIADPSCVKAYSQRVNTKWEHQREIRQRTGWRDYRAAPAQSVRVPAGHAAVGDRVPGGEGDR